MKKFVTCIAVAAALAAAAASFPTGVAAAVSDPYTVEGGRVVYTFEDTSDLRAFGRYSQLGYNMYVAEGKLWSYVFGEQKVVLKDKQFEDVDVSVDIETLNARGKFGSGIYVGASNPSDAADGITAWQVAVERDAGQPSYNVRLHYFQNGSYVSYYAAAYSIPVVRDVIHLRVVVKDNVIYAFTDGRREPLFSCDTSVWGGAAGMVGLRCYYSPNRFDNFSVTGELLPVDTAEMDALAEAAQAKLKENLAAESRSALEAALALAEAATTQTETDDAAAALSQAIGRAVTAHTAAELAALIERAAALRNPEEARYTANSWASLQKVLEIAQTKTAAGERELSYWYERLDARVRNLIAYGGASQ